MRKILDQHIRKGRELIKQHGWMVQHVFGDEKEPAFSYTVGLSQNHAHPEVYMVGINPETCQSILNGVGRHVRDGLRFDAPGYSDVIVDGYLAAFRPVSKKSVLKYSNAGRAMLNASFEAMQLFLPDVEGRFPWDEGCDPRYASIQTSLLVLEGEPPPRQ